MAVDPNQYSPQELVQRIKETYGITWAEFGDRMGRSEKMIRKIAKGETSGEAYRAALNDLFTHGEIHHPTPRRRDKGGHIVPVRAKAGGPAATVVPQDPLAKITTVPRRGKFTVDHPAGPEAESRITLFQAGARMVEIKFPKSRGAKGRAAGIAALEDQLRRVTKGQRNKDKRVKIQAVWDTGDGHGRIMDIGSKNGYHASDVLGDVRRDFGGDTAAWIASQSGERYEDLDIKKAPLVGVTLVIFDAIRSKEERKAMDVRGTRRRKWRR